jgi:hypothetical protein
MRFWFSKNERRPDYAWEFAWSYTWEFAWSLDLGFKERAATADVVPGVCVNHSPQSGYHVKREYSTDVSGGASRRWARRGRRSGAVIFDNLLAQTRGRVAASVSATQGLSVSKNGGDVA